MVKAVKTGVGAAAFLLIVALAGSLFGLLPGFLSFENPVRTEQVVRDHPAILESLTDVSEYTAATGTYSVIIDHEEDVRYVPSMIAGEREKLLAVGEVDAVVDFSTLTDDAITVDGASGRVVVTLPPVELGDVTVDHQRTEVIDRDRGVLNRIGGVFSDAPTSERDLLIGADARLVDAARDSELLARGQSNTAAMLQGLLAELGYDDVVIAFEAPAGAASA